MLAFRIRRDVSVIMGLAVAAWGAAGCGSPTHASSDGGANGGGANGGACVDLETSAYDTSCRADDDCVAVYAGVLCDGYTCMCSGAAINAASEARYRTAVASVHPGAGPLCQCPYLGRARCVQTKCVYCPTSGPSPAGCGDAG